MWKLLREKVGVPSLCCFFGFWYLKNHFLERGRPTDNWSLIQVEATLYLLHLSVARSHTWVLRKAELCKSIFASHNRVFFLLFWVFILQMVLMFYDSTFSRDKWFRPTDNWSHFLVEATLYKLDLIVGRSHMWVLSYIKVFMLHTPIFCFTVVILHAS